MIFARVPVNNKVRGKIKIIKWKLSLNGFYLGACRTVTWGEIDIIKWNVQIYGFCLCPIICEKPRPILLATGG